MEAHGRVNSSTLRIHQLLQAKPLLTIAEASHRVGLSAPTVAASLAALAEVGIVREITGRKRNRVYLYTDYLAILNEGTEPITPY